MAAAGGYALAKCFNSHSLSTSGLAWGLFQSFSLHPSKETPIAFVNSFYKSQCHSTELDGKPELFIWLLKQTLRWVFNNSLCVRERHRKNCKNK